METAGLLIDTFAQQVDLPQLLQVSPSIGQLVSQSVRQSVSQSGGWWVTTDGDRVKQRTTTAREDAGCAHVCRARTPALVALTP